VYGFSKEVALDLREFRNNHGLLREGIKLPNRKPLLPLADSQPNDCRRDPQESDIGCFLAGDIRSNEQLGLLAMHTIWFREHNRVATELRHINPHWDGDMLYHEARKIVGAEVRLGFWCESLGNCKLKQWKKQIRDKGSGVGSSEDCPF
jgi:peroxidase